MSKATLKNPTVGDVIDFLRQFPGDTLFAIEDPDTGWRVEIIHTGFHGKTLYLTGRHCEMDRDWYMETGDE